MENLPGRKPNKNIKAPEFVEITESWLPPKPKAATCADKARKTPAGSKKKWYFLWIALLGVGFSACAPAVVRHSGEQGAGQVLEVTVLDSRAYTATGYAARNPILYTATVTLVSKDGSQAFTFTTESGRAVFWDGVTGTSYTGTASAPGFVSRGFKWMPDPREPVSRLRLELVAD